MRSRFAPLTVALVASVVACGGSPPAGAAHQHANGASGTGGTSALILPIVGGGGCADTPDGQELDPDPLCAGTSPQISFRSDVASLVACSGEACHQAWRYDTLVGRASGTCCDRRPLVLPGHPSASHLVQAVRGVDSCVGRMGDLDPVQIAVIEGWICEGAPDN